VFVLQPEAIFGLKMRKEFGAGARSKSLQRSPDPVARFKGAASRQGRTEKGGGEMGVIPTTSSWIHRSGCVVSFRYLRE